MSEGVSEWVRGEGVLETGDASTNALVLLDRRRGRGDVGGEALPRDGGDGAETTCGRRRGVVFRSEQEW